MIEAKALSARYGRVGVLRLVDLSVGPGEVVALLGANGAGKTTLLHSLAGLHRSVTGQVLVEGRDVIALDAAERARQGMSLVPSGRQIFAEFTVRQNLLLGLHGTGLDPAEREERMKYVTTMFPILGEFATRQAGLLSGGQQQMLAVGRALVRRPAYLLLDEPSLGLAPQVVSQILSILETLTQDGMGILLAEQNAAAALEVSRRGIILENGTVVRSDAADVLLNDPEVSSHYLGTVGAEVGTKKRSVLPPKIFEPLEG